MNESGISEQTNLSIQIGAAGATVSALVLLSMAFISLPVGIEYPGLPVLTGAVSLSVSDSAGYLSGMRTLFALDGVFLLGWILAWTGLSELVRGVDRTRAFLVLSFGLVGALMDFGENGILLGAMDRLVAGVPATGNWIIAWKVVQHLSYWLPFAGALLAAVPLRRFGLLGRIASLVGSILLLPAGVGLYLPILSLVPNVWFLAWFACLAGLLWTHAGEDPNLKTRKR